MKSIILPLCALLFTFTLVCGAYAADYAGYYVSFACQKDGGSKAADNSDGFPAKYVAHLQFHENGTYEGILYSALTNGRWHKMKNQSGNEFLGLTIEETVDKELEETYGLGNPAFVFRYYEDVYVLGQLESEELIYMDKREGELDTDKVLDEIEKYLSGS